jgi:SAM-dependent methyltransferase
MRRLSLAPLKKNMGSALLESVKRSARRLGMGTRERIEVLSGKRDKLTPPARLVDFTGGGDFQATGRELLSLFRQGAGLKPSERILDVGCGVGRVAVALISFVNSEGSYDGFDCWREGIAWCTRRITKAMPNFRFQHVDCYNAFYNPAGCIRPRDLKFPYPTSSFDFVILNSVFTHMLPDDAIHYLDEIRRVLSSRGRMYASWFLVRDETGELVRGDYRFRRGQRPYATVNEEVPESAVAYPVGWVQAAYERAGLTITDEQNGPAGNEIQDILWATPSPRGEQERTESLSAT